MISPEILALGKRAQEMIDGLAAITAEPGRVTRLYLTPEHKRAAILVGQWMEEAGLAVHMDSAGTMHGLLPAVVPGAGARRRLLVGSHIDSVIDAGRYDGTLGVVVGILAAGEIARRKIALPFSLEILAFGDEEGVRFPQTLISSSAIAGILPPDILDVVDAAGMSLRAALTGFGADPARLAAESYRSADVMGYIEVHIEQGPVLEETGNPLGVVTAIASQGRLRGRVTGTAGHAGTVPMALRRDALAGAAEIVGAVEQVALESGGAVVATVGEIKAEPGASNVIPAAAEFSIDVRAAADSTRQTAAEKIRRRAIAVGRRRGLEVEIETVHETPVAVCAPRLQAAIAKGIAGATGNDDPPRLMSGAGHDGHAMIHLTDIGMMFVRCRGGISHNPLEFVAIEDMGVAVDALVETIVQLVDERNLLSTAH
jgi:allantoate deiminase